MSDLPMVRKNLIYSRRRESGPMVRFEPLLGQRHDFEYDQRHVKVEGGKDTI
jgi:hypothetical protein